MKLKLIIVTAFLFATGVANSAPLDPDSSLSITRLDSSSVYLLQYTASETADVMVTIRDSNGAMLATRSVADTKRFLLPMNLEAVAEGVYTVHVNNGSENETQEIDYNNDTAPTYTHVVSLGQSRYLLTASHAGTEDISIRVYDGAGELVFDEKRTIHGSTAVLFNLKNVSGKPSIVVSENSGHSLVVVQ